jgi:hypothetical protein
MAVICTDAGNVAVWVVSGIIIRNLDAVLKSRDARRVGFDGCEARVGVPWNLDS